MTIGIAGLACGITTLGPGTRVVLWVQGCDLSCPGCMSPELFDRHLATWCEVETLASRIIRLAEGHQGLTISGGEPFQQAEGLADMVSRIRRERSDLDVLVYSGYTLAEIHSDPSKSSLAKLADMIIDARYDPRAPNTLAWRGSDNQTLHALSDAGRRATQIAPSTTRLQVGFDGEILRLVGIPRRGNLARAERQLALAGVRLRKGSV